VEVTPKLLVEREPGVDNVVEIVPLAYVVKSRLAQPLGKFRRVEKSPHCAGKTRGIPGLDQKAVAPVVEKL